MKTIGFVGNSCTGKTTAAFGLIAELKFQRALVGYITDMARSIPFPPDRLDTDPRARLHVLFRQLAAETEQTSRPDVDYVVTERTAIDWWLYYLWTCRNVGQEPDLLLESFIREWSRARYDVLVFMSGDGMEYVDDGYRPASTQIRDAVEPLYQRQLHSLRSGFPGELVQIGGADVRDRAAEVHYEVMKRLAPVHVRPSRVALGAVPR